jgi:hypothetical protein
VNDIAIIRNDNKYLLFLMDERRGIIIVEMTYSPDGLSFQTIINNIGKLGGGFAIDTYDGHSVFALYKTKNYY